MTWKEEIGNVLTKFAVDILKASRDRKSFKEIENNIRNISNDALAAITEATDRLVIGEVELLLPDVGTITNGVITERNALKAEQRKVLGGGMMEDNQIKEQELLDKIGIFINDKPIKIEDLTYLGGNDYAYPGTPSIRLEKSKNVKFLMKSDHIVLTLPPRIEDAQ